MFAVLLLCVMCAHFFVDVILCNVRKMPTLILCVYFE